jgi:hypothetical protein
LRTSLKYDQETGRAIPVNLHRLTDYCSDLIDEERQKLSDRYNAYKQIDVIDPSYQKFHVGIEKYRYSKLINSLNQSSETITTDSEDASPTHEGHGVRPVRYPA